ncbi:hypothetical protein chiPu_0032894, partial [Chiloscyllium punctatum]|nr:hypothetical protein [Chiloscyllium punctatum]
HGIMLNEVYTRLAGEMMDEIIGNLSSMLKSNLATEYVPEFWGTANMIQHYRMGVEIGDRIIRQ